MSENEFEHNDSNNDSDMSYEHDIETVEIKTLKSKRMRYSSSDSAESYKKTKRLRINSDTSGENQHNRLDVRTKIIKPSFVASEIEERVPLYKRSRRHLRIFSTSSEEDEGLQENVNSISNYTAENYSWSKKYFVPKLYDFDESNSGIRGHLSEISTALDAFKIFFSEELITGICENTNNFHKNLAQTKIHAVHSRVNNWTDTSRSEIYLFIAITMLMSRIKKTSIREYWSTDKVTKTEIFSKLMSRVRYESLLKMLHFNDDNNMSSNDPLIKIRPVVTKLRNSFSKSFYPYKYLCIDESLLLYKGRLFFKQYIPTKRSRFGIKSFIICDCKTGYILDFIIYSGKNSDVTEEVPSIGQSGNITLTLLKSYLGKGHTLITDNWYTSPHLYNLLHEKEKTNAFGTVRQNRKDMPKMEEKLKGGECVSRSTHNLLALKWRDKKDVWMLSTSHSDDFVETKKINYQTGEPKRKPKCVADYNALMGAVDKIDMTLSSLHCVRKSTRWYKKYFFHLLDLAIYNAYILHKNTNEKIVTFEKFHLRLIKDILREYPPDRVETKGGRSHSDDLPFRLTERHFLSSCVTNENRKHSSRRRCVVCTKNNRRTDSRYECKKCNVGLCIEPCFESYHTIQNY